MREARRRGKLRFNDCRGETVQRGKMMSRCLPGRRPAPHGPVLDTSLVDDYCTPSNGGTTKTGLARGARRGPLLCRSSLVSLHERRDEEAAAEAQDFLGLCHQGRQCVSVAVGRGRSEYGRIPAEMAGALWESEMAESLMKYLDKGRPKGFEPRPYYGHEEDWLTFYFDNAESYAKRVDELLTLVPSMT